MKRSELKEWGIEDKEVLDKIMSAYGEAIEDAKSEVETLKKTILERENDIKSLNEKVNGLDGSETALKELQDKVAVYEKQEAERKEAEKNAQMEADIKARFSTVLGEQKFKHTDIETGRFNAFKEAIGKPEYAGKGDADIFADVIKDMDCFVNPQQAPITLPAGNSSQTTKPEFKTFF